MTTGPINDEFDEGDVPGIKRRSVLRGIAVAGALGTGLLGATSTVGATSHTSSGVGGPVVLMGIDAEDGSTSRPNTAHGGNAIYQGVVNDIMANVNNGNTSGSPPTGDILVIGGKASEDTGDFWNLIGTGTGNTVTLVSGAANITSADFSSYAMLGVVSSVEETDSGGLTDAENDALAARAGDVAAFVNDGGGLLGFSQDGLTNAWAYIGAIGSFTTAEEGYDDVTATPDGNAIGINDSNLDVCCWHDVFLTFPSFLNVLATHNGFTNVNVSTQYDGEAAAIGGAQVILGGGLPCTTDLLASQDVDVGSVQAGYDDTSEVMTVRYDTSEINPGGDPGEWYLAETHLDVEDDFDDFPTAGKNNPKVGHFDVIETYGPGVDTAVFDVPVAPPSDDELVIAAHAVVYQVDCTGETLTSLTGNDTTLMASFSDPIYAGGDLTVTNPSEDVTVYLTRDGTMFELGDVSAGTSETFTSLADLVDIDLDDDGDDDVAWFDGVKLDGVANSTDLTVGSIEASCLVTVDETAWGDGCVFNAGRNGNGNGNGNGKGNWATYIEYDVTSDECGCL